MAVVMWSRGAAAAGRVPLASFGVLVRGVRTRSRDRGAVVTIVDPPAVGFAPWSPAAQRRWSWPLFGVATTPPAPPGLADLARTTFGQGGRYLGDEGDLCTEAAGAAVTWSEVAVIGRSNVGKSSLLNALLGSRDHSFVPVSRHPGSTMHLDFYGVGTANPPALVLVDTPGYGYNRHGRAAEAAWLDMLQRYLRSRQPAVLLRTLVLLDARHGLVGNDAQVLAALDAARVPYTVVLTKADALGDAAMEVQAANLALALSRRGMLTPIMHAVSAHTGGGMLDLQMALVHAAKLHLTPTRASSPLPFADALAASWPAVPSPSRRTEGKEWNSGHAQPRGEPRPRRPVAGDSGRGERNRAWPTAAASEHRGVAWRVQDGNPQRGAVHRPSGRHAGRDMAAPPPAQRSPSSNGGGGLKRLPDGTIGWRRRKA